MDIKFKKGNTNNATPADTIPTNKITNIIDNHFLLIFKNLSYFKKN
jgi:hypothetical protein